MSSESRDQIFVKKSLPAKVLEEGIIEFSETGIELVKVDSGKIEFIDMLLKKLGVNPRQTLKVNRFL